MLLQVAGRKRVTLLPPDAHPCAYLFPSLHPRARKSQVPAYARAPLPSSRRRRSSASDSNDNSSDAGRGDARAPNFLAFLQNGTWLAPGQRPTALERQFPKLLGYLRTGTCDHPGSASGSGSSSLGRGRAVRNGSASHNAAWWPSAWGARGRRRRATRPWAVVLAPGDALYVPPGWLHSVEALDASVSVNAFAPSTEVRVGRL